MTPISRHLRAVRAARPSQLAARPLRLVPPALLAPRPSAPPDWQPRDRFSDRAPQSGAQTPPHVDGIFRAFGEQRAFTDDAAFWRSGSLLFQFHLHAFAGLEPHPFWERVLDSWLEHCARPARPAWHPYPMSSRILAWCSWPTDGLRESLYAQARTLARTLEYDVGGNHLLHNAVALIAAGRCTGDGRLERRGRKLLDRQLREQILPGGGHYERSPSYHRALLEELEYVGPAPENMRAWLDAMTAPDGAVPLFNDAWEGPPRTPGIEPFTDLDDYIVFRHADDFAVFDAGPLAPKHLPPHAHADALAFTLWLDGRPLITDPGAGTYSGPRRDALRGTAAHATVQVGHRDQCDFWGPFRATRLPNVHRVALSRHGDAVVVTAEHDGYRPAMHRRTFVWLPGDGVVIVDRIEADDVTTRLPLHPDADAFDIVALGDGSPATSEPGVYAPYLGTFRDTTVLVRRPSAKVFGWAILRSGTATLTDRRLTVGGLELDLE